jgi:RHS repeat-associated protein
MSTQISLSRCRHDLFFLLTLAAVTPVALANYIGGERPNLCAECGAPNFYTGGKAGVGLTEGNEREIVPITTVQSSTAPTLELNLTYNSYNADSSHALVDTVLGYGWTHSYNAFLFAQVGSMFCMDCDGRTEKFTAGPGGAYSSDAGYFETLVKNLDGSFTLTTKNKTSYRFAIVSGTHFQVGGPVYRLQSITDRNNNVTTLGYASGNLVSVTDTYGRSLQFTYNALGQMTNETDPLGRVTTFAYDGTGRRLASVTDPTGKVTSYSYNALNQIATKTDGDGRRYTYQYQGNLPVGIKDSSSSNLFSLSNPDNWATSSSTLAEAQERVYTPSTSQQTDGRGNTWRYQYDTNGYPINTIAPDGSTTRYQYDAGSLEVSTMTDANGRVTTYQYDGEGNRIRMTDAQGNVTTYTYEPIFNQITSLTDPNGRITTYQYDSLGNRTNTTDPLGQTQSLTYDSHGNILTQTDQRGYTTTYKYDAVGDRTNMTDALGNVTSYRYDGVGNLTNTTDPRGNTTTYQYDGRNRITSITDPLGHVTSYQYDADNDRIRITDPNTNSTSYAYDLRDRLIRTTNALGGITSMTYDANNNVIAQTDANGHATSFVYDTQNRLIRTTDALGHVSATTYDGVGNVTSTTDADGHTTTNTYDVLNRKITQIDALGDTTTYDYANTGGLPCCGATGGSALVTEMIDADGKITYYNYDELNRLVQTIRKSGGVTDVVTFSDAVTSTVYDADNNVIASTDANGNTTTYAYDALDRRVSVVDPAGDTTTTFYDSVGNVIETSDPRGNITTTIYDQANRAIETDDSLGSVSRTAYDAVGNVIETIDGLGNTTANVYDDLNRQIESIDPLGHTSTTSYDPVGNVISQTDRDGHTTTFTYDAINRQVSITDGLGHTTSTVYDPVGNVNSVTDANGHTTTYTYDAVNRPIQETFPDEPADKQTYTYDPVGNVISRVDQEGRTTSYQYNDFYYITNRQYATDPADQFTYDLGGRLLTATRSSWIDTFAYDGAGRVVATTQNGETITYVYNVSSGTRTVTYPGGRVITEHTDLRGRLAEVDDGGAPSLAQYTYDAANNLLTRTDRNATVATYSYNSNNWVTNLSHTNGASIIVGFTYTYDNEGNRSSELKQHAPGDSETYAYDAINRLVQYDVGTISGGSILSPVIAKTWSLDALGNWSSLLSNLVTQTRTHNAVNEIQTINAQTLTYDADGNLSNDGSYTYAYDMENRLTAVTRDSDAALVGRYFYDALGRRIIQIADPAGAPSTNVFFYDSERIIEEQNAAAVTQATYTYGSNYLDDVLTMDRGGDSYYYHANSLASPEALSDPTGSVVERYSYDAYGEVTVLDPSYNPLPLNAWGTPHSPVGNPYLFTGRELDEEAGLYYYRTRGYDANKGRFLQRDSVGYVDGLNLYQYADDNPTDKMDPDGKDSDAAIKFMEKEWGCDVVYAYQGLAIVYKWAVNNYNRMQNETKRLNKEWRAADFVKWYKTLCATDKSIVDHYLKYFQRLPGPAEGLKAKPYVIPATDRYQMKSITFIRPWWAPQGISQTEVIVDTQTGLQMPFDGRGGGVKYYPKYRLPGMFTSGGPEN